MPGEALLRQYMAQGGQYVTLGSDAHAAEDLYAGVHEARGLAEGLGLRPVVFRGRKRMV
jgi:histidinol-phosphatase (PHP family)